MRANLTQLLLVGLGALVPAAWARAEPAPLPPGASYEAAFSPGDGAIGLVLAAIASARSQVLVAAYGFTNTSIAKALVSAQRRGVTVQVVADEAAHREGGGRYSALSFLANQGVAVRLNGRYAILHSKFMVIDGEHLELGSFNYTSAAARKNQENVLLLRHVPPLAQQYAAQWQQLWDEGEALSKAY